MFNFFCCLVHKDTSQEIGNYKKRTRQKIPKSFFSIPKPFFSIWNIYWFSMPYVFNGFYTGFYKLLAKFWFLSLFVYFVVALWFGFTNNKNNCLPEWFQVNFWNWNIMICLVFDNKFFVLKINGFLSFVTYLFFSFI